jgi:hypothetical protein
MLQSKSIVDISGGTQPVKNSDTHCDGMHPPLFFIALLLRFGVDGSEPPVDDVDDVDVVLFAVSETGSSQNGTTLSKWCTRRGQW